LIFIAAIDPGDFTPQPADYYIGNSNDQYLNI